MIIGKRIKELRTEKGLSQKTVADAIGVSQQIFSWWENDVNQPKAEYIFRLAQYFDVSSDYLLGLED